MFCELEPNSALSLRLGCKEALQKGKGVEGASVFLLHARVQIRYLPLPLSALPNLLCI